MSGWAGWVSLETMRLMGLALLHFLWQGAALGAAAFLAMSLARRAAVRYVLGVSLMAVMVAAPAVTFFVLTQRQAAGLHSSQGANASVASAASEAQAIPGTAQQVLSFGDTASRVPSVYLLWFVEAWFVGVLLLSLRPAAGFLLIERLRLKHGTPVSDALRARCAELQRRLGLHRVVRYCESLQLEAPAVVGWFRPVILLPVSALTGLTTDQLYAVIAHELAHVKRYDAFVNVFQMAAEALLFYHPAVWWLSKRIREERELCCDDMAIAVCGNAAEYARALAAMADWQTAPALAMAANRSPLTERVARLLGAEKLHGGLRGAGIAGSALCLCASMLAGNALLHAAQRSQGAKREPQTAPVLQPALIEAEGPSVVVNSRPVVAGDKSSVIKIPSQGLLPAPVTDPHRIFFPQRDAGPDKEQREQAEAAGRERSQSEPRENSDQEERAAKNNSYIEGLEATGLTNLSVDQLIAMKIQGVTPDYVRSIHELGLKPGIDEWIAMRIQGVTPELIRSMRESGLATEIGEIIAMRVQGVTPQYVKQLHDAGLEADAGRILAMKVQGISPEYIREMRAVTDAKLPADELIGMKIQGVTPEYVREMKSLGLRMNASDLIDLKVQGVTPEYLKAMQAAGLKMDAREVIGAKVQGFTPEFVTRARQHGFQNLDLPKLLALKNSGVLDE